MGRSQFTQVASSKVQQEASTAWRTNRFGASMIARNDAHRCHYVHIWLSSLSYAYTLASRWLTAAIRTYTQVWGEVTQLAWKTRCEKHGNFSPLSTPRGAVTQFVENEARKYQFKLRISYVFISYTRYQASNTRSNTHIFLCSKLYMYNKFVVMNNEVVVEETWGIGQAIVFAKHSLYKYTF